MATNLALGQTGFLPNRSFKKGFRRRAAEGSISDVELRAWLSGAAVIRIPQGQDSSSRRYPSGSGVTSRALGEKQKPVRIKLMSGEIVRGWIEYYDRRMVRLTREVRPTSSSSNTKSPTSRRNPSARRVPRHTRPVTQSERPGMSELSARTRSDRARSGHVADGLLRAPRRPSSTRAMWTW